MSYLQFMGSLWLFTVLCSVSTFAQIESSGTSPGFDPTPVEIPRVRKTTARPVTCMDLLGLRELHGIQISPDGRHVAFVVGEAVFESNSYRTGLFVVGTQLGSNPTSLGSAGPPRWALGNQWIPEDPQWSPDSNEIYYRLKPAGTWQVWRWKLNDRIPVRITRTRQNVRSFQVSPDGTQLALVVEKPDSSDERVLGEKGILYDGSLPMGQPAPIRDEVIKLRREGAVSTEVWTHDLQHDSERKATQKEVEAYSSWDYAPSGTSFSAKEIEEEHIMSVKISPDATMMAYQRWIGDSSQSSPWSYPLFLKSTKEGPSVDFTPGVYYVDQYWWSPDSKEIYYTQYDGDGHSARLMRRRVAGGKPQKLLDTTDYLSEYSADHSGRLVACSRESSTSPPKVAIADLSNGQIRTLVDLNPEFNNIQLGSAQRFDFSNESGDHFWGHLVLPLNKPGIRHPLIITTYADDDGFLRGAVGDEYPIQVFAANGFAVLDFNRGEFREKVGDFDSTIRMLQSPLEGLAVAIQKLGDMGLVDPMKVGISGLSTGAGLVDYGISHTRLFHAAIDSGGGAWDPLAYFLGSDKTRTYASSIFGLGLPQGELEKNWQRISTSFNIQHISAPLLINAADSEYLLDAQLITTLRQRNRPGELFIYTDELHEKNQPKHRYEIYERNVDWFNFWLMDKEDSSPRKAEQNRRWEALKKLTEQMSTTDTGP